MVNKHPGRAGHSDEEWANRVAIYMDGGTESLMEYLGTSRANTHNAVLFMRQKGLIPPTTQGRSIFVPKRTVVLASELGIEPERLSEVLYALRYRLADMPS